MAQSNSRSADRQFESRLTAVENLLPTLATKEDLKTAIAEAVAPLPTREEMHAAIATAAAPLATRAELSATRDELYSVVREEGERTRRHFDVVSEDLRGDIRLLAEGQVALHQRVEGVRVELQGSITQLDRRVTRLEAARG